MYNMRTVCNIHIDIFIYLNVRTYVRPNGILCITKIVGFILNLLEYIHYVLLLLHNIPHIK